MKYNLFFFSMHSDYQPLVRFIKCWRWTPFHLVSLFRNIPGQVYAIYTDITGAKQTVACTVIEYESVNYYVITNMKVYDMTAVITLALDAKGTEKLLDYNLAAYSKSAGGQRVTVDEALCSFALASQAFKADVQPAE